MIRALVALVGVLVVAVAILYGRAEIVSGRLQGAEASRNAAVEALARAENQNRGLAAQILEERRRRSLHVARVQAETERRRVAVLDAQAENEKLRREIDAALAGNDCDRVVVPAGAVDGLRRAADRANGIQDD